MAKKPTLADADLYQALRGKFKKIQDYTDQELDATIAVLAHDLPLAYQYLNFIDAYFERRERKAASSNLK